MSLASGLTSLVDALITAINARAGRVGASAYDLYVLGGGTLTQAQWIALQTQQRFSCKVYRATGTANQLFFGTGGAGADIPCPVVEYNDSTDYFDTTTNAGRITVKKAGLYEVNWRLRYGADGNTGLRDARLLKNGAVVAENGCATSNNAVVIPGGAQVLRLAANDVLTLNGYSDAAAVAISATTGTDISLTATFLGT
jgi:hypothetical protein